jgi:hypothetical protein
MTAIPNSKLQIPNLKQMTTLNSQIPSDWSVGACFLGTCLTFGAWDLVL